MTRCRAVVGALLLAGCSISSSTERSRCIDHGGVVLLDEVAGEAVMVACIPLEQFQDGSTP